MLRQASLRPLAQRPRRADPRPSACRPRLSGEARALSRKPRRAAGRCRIRPAAAAGGGSRPSFAAARSSRPIPRSPSFMRSYEATASSEGNRGAPHRRLVADRTALSPPPGPARTEAAMSSPSITPATRRNADCRCPSRICGAKRIRLTDLIGVSRFTIARQRMCRARPLHRPYAVRLEGRGLAGAGEGNRTPVRSLGSSCSAIELHPLRRLS